MSVFKRFTKKNTLVLIFKAQTIKKTLLFLIAFCIGIYSIAQDSIDYNINGELDFENNKIQIQQNLSFTNPALKPLDTIFLTDWANSFSSKKTPLAKRAVEEYNRKIHISNKKKLGYTEIGIISSSGEELAWERLNNQQDIIRIVLKRPLGVGQRIILNLDYLIKLPDASFTGYGRDNDQINLRYWNLSLSPFFNEEWHNYSNINITDYSVQHANYKVQFTSNKKLNIFSNLNNIDSKNENNFHFLGTQKKEAEFVITAEDRFEKFVINDQKLIETNFYLGFDNKQEVQKTLEKIDGFVSSLIGTEKVGKTLVPLRTYSNNPFYGLNDLPKILSPFEKDFLTEISFLKTYLHYYLNQSISVDLREKHWLIGGLQTYMIIKYIEKFYPNKKYLGRIADLKLLRGYVFSDLKFNEGFIFYSEFMIRNNLHQSDFTSKEELIKFNEKIASPYHVGIGFRFLEEYIGIDVMKTAIKEYINTSNTETDFIKIIKSKTEKDINWFDETYLNSRNAMDFSIEKVTKVNDSLKIDILSKNGNQIPFLISQVKNESLLDLKWHESKGEITQITIKNLSADYLALNPEFRLPESNSKNNWRFMKNKVNFKPIHFSLFKDYETPKKTQLFFMPDINYSLYDGIIIGSKFYNKGVTFNKLNLELKPLYSSEENTLVGSFGGSYVFQNEDKSNFRTQINISASSYFYDKKLRYQILVPGIAFYFRTPDLRSNKRHYLSLFYYDVLREGSIDADPNYKIFNFRHKFTNRNVIYDFKTESSFQVSDKFGKLDFTAELRKLLTNGRQLGIRFFAGKFLWNDQISTKFFDFNLVRPKDYLFRYNYFGRSENDGVYSQQIVMAEGGFKSINNPSSANDYLLATNLTLGVWKWVEAYVDFGLVKNRNIKAKSFFSSGIRLNMVTDYLEIFFPVYGSHGFAFDETPYEQKIRFILTLSSNKLFTLFSRKWF